MTQHKESITLEQLYNRIGEYLITHPNDKNKQIYFNCLHIKGYIDSIGIDYLELI